LKYPSAQGDDVAWPSGREVPAGSSGAIPGLAPRSLGPIAQSRHISVALRDPIFDPI
jgi:hypothetical protein